MLLGLGADRRRSLQWLVGLARQERPAPFSASQPGARSRPSWSAPAPLGVQGCACAAARARTAASISSATSTTAPTAGSTGARLDASSAGCSDVAALRQRARHPRGLHHAAARLAAAHRRAARAGAGNHRLALLRARRVRHQHHPGPAAGHERRAGRRHLRDAVHRHQRRSSSGSATSCSPPSS